MLAFFFLFFFCVPFDAMRADAYVDVAFLQCWINYNCHRHAMRAEAYVDGACNACRRLCRCSPLCALWAYDAR